MKYIKNIKTPDMHKKTGKPLKGLPVYSLLNENS